MAGWRTLGREREPGGSPEKALMAAVIKCAWRDYLGRRRVNERARQEAEAFLRSEVYLMLCDWLGVRPSARFGPDPAGFAGQPTSLPGKARPANGSADGRD